MGVGGQRHAPTAFAPGKDPVLIVQEAGWAPAPVWTVAENLAAPTGIRSPDRPARSESLYRLSYPGTLIYFNVMTTKCRHLSPQANRVHSLLLTFLYSPHLQWIINFHKSFNLAY
jgi:hypothetical protein